MMPAYLEELYDVRLSFEPSPSVWTRSGGGSMESLECSAQIIFLLATVNRAVSDVSAVD